MVGINKRNIGDRNGNKDWSDWIKNKLELDKYYLQ